MPLRHDESVETSTPFHHLISLLTAVHGRSDMAMIADQVLGVLVEAFEADRGLMVAGEAPMRSRRRHQVVRYWTAPDVDATVAGPRDQAQTVAEWALEAGKTALVSSESATPEAWPFWPLQDASSSMMAMPLGRRHSLGALVLERSGRPYTTADVALLQDYAVAVVQALENAQAHRDFKERLGHLEMLDRLFSTIGHNLDLTKMLDLALSMTMEITRAERAFIFLAKDGELTFGAGHDEEGALEPGMDLGISRSACQRVLDLQEGVYLFNTTRDPELAGKFSVPGMELKSIIAVPLVGQTGSLGVLYVDSRKALPSDVEAEMFVVSAIASQAAMLIENAQLFRQATVDSLTGLFVRAYFLNRLEEETRRATRYGGRFSLLIVDIDHFKRLNDTYGHQTGDVVLHQVAQTIPGALRTGIDLVGRYGGEEMLALLPETDTEGARVAAERIRRSIAEAEFKGVNGESLHVTVSIGVSTFPEHAATSEELFARADEALYSSKHGGRNQVTVFGATEST